MRRILATRLLAVWLAVGCAGIAAAESQTYTYVKFSLGVPWALYFVFLLLVLMPFAVMILLAWRRGSREAEKPDSK